MVTMKQLIFISKIYILWRKRLIFSKSLIFMWCLALTYGFVEYRVVAIFIDILIDTWKQGNLSKAAIFTNLQDGLSSLFVIYTHVLAAYTGRFSVIISCTAAYVMGLMLFWVSTLTFPKVGTLIYVAGILLIALGRAGLPTLRGFLEYQLKEIVRVRQRIEDNQDRRQADISEEENDHVFRVNIWWRSARILGALIATISPAEMYWSETFKIAVLAMVSSFLLFFSGYFCYTFEEPTGTPLTKIYRVFKVAICKFKFEYPGSLERYYWKNYIHNHTYRNRIGQVQLLPHVPSLWRWLDKAAIIGEPQPQNPSPERQEMDGDLCTVKEVREVKRFASLIHLSFTLLPYSMVVAAGNTFFVEQTSNLRLTVNISALFLLKSIVRDVVIFLIWLKKLTKQIMTKVRIAVGMAFSVICCITAFLVERRRLSLIKEEGVIDHADEEISMGTAILVPQFLLLGLMEALADEGLEQLFDNYVPESMWSFGEPFNEFVIGIGKLLTIPCISIITGWFKESMNTSHLDRYYLLLAILNFVFIFIYGYYSTKYKEDYPEDEELRTAEMQEITENSHQASQEEANGILINPLPLAISVLLDGTLSS